MKKILITLVLFLAISIYGISSALATACSNTNKNDSCYYKDIGDPCIYTLQGKFYIGKCEPSLVDNDSGKCVCNPADLPPPSSVAPTN